MHWLDWILVISFICLLALAAVKCMKYAGTVVKFLAAGRCAGRYVLIVSEGMAGAAVISFVGAFEMYYNNIDWSSGESKKITIRSGNIAKTLTIKAGQMTSFTVNHS